MTKVKTKTKKVSSNLQKFDIGCLYRQSYAKGISTSERNLLYIAIDHKQLITVTGGLIRKVSPHNMSLYTVAKEVDIKSLKENWNIQSLDELDKLMSQFFSPKSRGVYKKPPSGRRIMQDLDEYELFITHKCMINRSNIDD